jgi:hypothetical protein
MNLRYTPAWGGVPPTARPTRAYRLYAYLL